VRCAPILRPTDFPRLPAEIFSYIIALCEIDALHSLYATCQALQQKVSLAIRYRQVDLSAHNIGHKSFKQRNDTLISYWGDSWPPRFNIPKLARRQQRFLSDLSNNPYIGTLVHEMTWTIHSRYLPTNEDFGWADTQIWEAFERFKYVTKLDLACYQESWDWDYLRKPPKQIFSNAKDVRLSGIIYRQIVSIIIGSIDLLNL